MLLLKIDQYFVKYSSLKINKMDDIIYNIFIDVCARYIHKLFIFIYDYIMFAL